MRHHSAGPLLLKPCLAELLRTTDHPATLVVRVEHIFGKAQPPPLQPPAEAEARRGSSHRNSKQTENEDGRSEQDHDGDLDGQIGSKVDFDSASASPHCLHLAVSDGHLQLQALLGIIPEQTLGPGDLVQITRFQVRKAPRLNGQGVVIYLEVDHCAWVGTRKDEHQSGEKDSTVDDDVQVDSEVEDWGSGGFRREESPHRVVEEPTESEGGGFLVPCQCEEDPVDMAKTKSSRDQPQAQRSRSNPLSRSASDLGRSAARRIHDADRTTTGVASRKVLRRPYSNVSSFSNPGRHRQSNDDDGDDSDSDNDGFFDTVHVSQSQLATRRHALRNKIEHQVERPSVVPVSVVPHKRTISEVGGPTGIARPEDPFSASEVQGAYPGTRPEAVNAVMPPTSETWAREMEEAVPTSPAGDDDLLTDDEDEEAFPVDDDNAQQQTASEPDEMAEESRPGPKASSFVSNHPPPLTTTTMTPTETLPSSTDARTNTTTTTTRDIATTTTASAAVAAPPIHTLASLLSPADPSQLPRRNYACTVLAVVSWVSPSVIHRSHLPFPPKRHVKVHDPSISHRQAGVSVMVFVDAKTFLPPVGTVALWKGVVMQRWQGEVILNKYAGITTTSDPAGDWFVADEPRLTRMGHDVAGMRRWWAERGANKR